MKFKDQEAGYILVEYIVSISLISIILISTSILFYFVFSSYKHHTETWETEHDAQIVLKYIEKRLREFNQENIIFDDKKNVFQGKTHENKSVWVDLSGEISNRTNTLIYFYKAKREIRVNKNNEHNVLSSNIKDVIITELVEGKLIEVEVITGGTNYSSKIKLNLNYRKN